MVDVNMWDELNNISNDQEDDDLDFDASELREPTEEEIAFAEDVYKVFQELINNEDQNSDEEFTSTSSLVNHFNKHCLGKNTNKKSNRQNVFYDFKHINQYKDREDKLNANIKKLSTSSKNIIGSLLDNEDVIKKFRVFFTGDKYLIFPPSCGFMKDNKYIILGLYAFSSNVTTNYESNNTIDLIIMSVPGKTVTMYPVDANYLENKLNNIIKNYNVNKISPLKFNH